MPKALTEGSKETRGEMELLGRKKARAEADRQKRIGQKLAQKRVQQHYKQYGPPPAKETGNPLRDLRHSTERLRATAEHAKAKSGEAIKSSQARLSSPKMKGLLEQAREKVSRVGKGLGKLGIVGSVTQGIDEAKRMKRSRELRRKVRENKPIDL